MNIRYNFYDLAFPHFLFPLIHGKGISLPPPDLKQRLGFQPASTCAATISSQNAGHDLGSSHQLGSPRLDGQIHLKVLVQLLCLAGLLGHDLVELGDECSKERDRREEEERAVDLAQHTCSRQSRIMTSRTLSEV